ncbi:MAG: sodium-dependent transporter [Ectothiorhodospiraceae bacterium]|nr:sodium-dependent transporter [Ectothiorhodospiraceae bacterium]
MAQASHTRHEQWSSGLVFILAATGSAVGLGNLWRFPYLVGENGGGAFVLIYLACIVLVGFPIMMAEVMIGRRGRQSPINTLRRVALEEGLSSGWQLVGWLGVAAGFLILSFYSVVGGWALYYALQALVGSFSGISSEGAGAMFRGLVSSPVPVVFWHTVFMLILFGIVVAGVRRGLQRAVTILMPLLFALLILLVLYGMTTGAFGQTLHFMFAPDFSAIDGRTVLTAMGQAFFTLSLGMGAIMVYGAYLPSSEHIPRATGWIVGMDTLTAIIAGLAIFPIVFSAGMAPGAGPGLVFETLPVVFGTIPFGFLLGILFFVLLSVAAITSGISLLEPPVAYLIESTRLGRRGATGLLVGGIWLLGIAAGLSLNVWAGVRIVPGLDANIFGTLEFLANDLMLPLGGLFIALFAAWFMRSASVSEELDLLHHGPVYRLWRVATRFIAPAAVILVFLNATGLFG